MSTAVAKQDKKQEGATHGKSVLNKLASGGEVSPWNVVEK